MTSETRSNAEPILIYWKLAPTVYTSAAIVVRCSTDVPFSGMQLQYALNIRMVARSFTMLSFDFLEICHLQPGQLRTSEWCLIQETF